MRFLLQAIFLITFTLYTSTTFAIPGDTLKLGHVEFVTSTASTDAKAHFNLGLKYLHNFMYPQALHEFKLAQQADPQFALSYWGQAMYYKWSLWSYENKQKGKKIMADFFALQHVKTTPLEKGFIEAVAKLYQPGTDLENEKNYLKAMQKLYQQYPHNADVISFYALAMLGYSMDAPYDKSGAHLQTHARTLLKSALKTYPDHPGIIHYYMHANDIPNTRFPNEGLAVKENVYRYLTDSSHVLHMTAHLYTALGDWKNAAEANFASIKASHAMCDMLRKEKLHIAAVDADDNKNNTSHWTDKEWYACDADNVYHSLEWLHYDYLQMKEYTKAAALVTEIQKIAALEKQEIYDFWAYRMLARQILYTKSYTPVTTLPKPLIEISKDKNWAAYSECGLLLAQGISAVKNKQLNELTLINGRYNKIISQLTNPSSAEYRDTCKLAQTEVLAYKHAEIEHDYDTCSNQLDAVKKIQEKLQSSDKSLTLPFLTSQEVYGDIMFAKPEYHGKIKKLYLNELQYYPNRTLAIEGLRKID